MEKMEQGDENLVQIVEQLTGSNVATYCTESQWLQWWRINRHDWLIFDNSPLAGIIYVDAEANGLNDGSSWENAYTFLQDAFTYLKSSGEQAEIRVAQGTYKPNQGFQFPFSIQGERGGAHYGIRIHLNVLLSIVGGCP